MQNQVPYQLHEEQAAPTPTQQQQTQENQHHQPHHQQHANLKQFSTPAAPKGRPLSISSISSAASSGSSSSGNSSASSGTQLSLTRNGSLNYGHEYRRCAYLASIERLSKRIRVVTEIIETERTYVDDLEKIVTGYLCYLRNVLQQQKHQNVNNDAMPHQSIPTSPTSTQQDVLVEPTNFSTVEFDDKSIMVSDDDATSATNEEVEETVTSLLNLDIQSHLEDTTITSTSTTPTSNSNTKPKVTTNNTTTTTSTTTTTTTTSSGAIMTASHIKNLFSNLEDIYKFNKDLLFRLEECYLNPSSVAECFVENALGFDVYTHYCTMFPQIVSTLTELMANQASAQLLKERQLELGQSLPLGAYLLKPVQRILKYHILFQSLIKHTTDDDTVDDKDRQLIEEAFSVMTNVARHINEMKKRHEHAIRVQEVQGLLSGWEGPDLTTLGELILEDTFKLYNRPKSSRHLFLFDNVLLITKMKRDGSLCYKGHIACTNLMLIENIEGQPLVFETVPFDNPKALCAFQAKNLDKKRDWCLQMKEVIIKSFEVQIPVHVREILMSLTNSATSDSSQKSRTIRAPNYLERKRSRQDIRK